MIVAAVLLARLIVHVDGSEPGYEATWSHSQGKRVAHRLQRTAEGTFVGEVPIESKEIRVLVAGRHNLLGSYCAQKTGVTLSPGDNHLHMQLRWVWNPLTMAAAGMIGFPLALWLLTYQPKRRDLERP